MSYSRLSCTQLCLLCNDADNIFIRHNMTKATPLRDMSRTRAPNHCILERLLQCTVNLIAYLFDGGFIPHDECFVEIGLFTFSLCVDSHQLQLVPAAFHNVLDPEIELAGHDHSVGFSSEAVKEIERYGVDLVVDV